MKNVQGLLNAMMPTAKTLGVLLNPKFPYVQDQLAHVKAAASAAGLHLQNLQRQQSKRNRAPRSKQWLGDRIPALSITADPFFDTRRDQLIALAAQRSLPVMSSIPAIHQAGRPDELRRRFTFRRLSDRRAFMLVAFSKVRKSASCPCCCQHQSSSL